MARDEILTSYELFIDILTRIREAEAHFPDNSYSGKSELWESFFKSRKTEYFFEEALYLHNNELSLTNGASIKIDRKHEQIYREYYEDHFSAEETSGIRVPCFGAPSISFIHDKPCNVSFLQNHVRVAHLKQIAAKLNFELSDLRVLEIGAGVGVMAQQLIDAGVVRNYTVVDLRENLLLSASYLCNVNEDLRTNVCGEIDTAGNGVLNFLVPQQMALLEDSEFDLVINCDSLGEMPASVARSYVDFVSKHLSQRGAFYSKNGHRRSAGTVDKISEYGYQKFNVEDFTPTPLPSMIFDDHSHVLMLTKKTRDQQIDWKAMDDISDLLKMGLSEELAGLCQAVISVSETDEEKNFLNYVNSIYSEKTEHPVTLRNPKLLLAYDYISGMFNVCHGDPVKGIAMLNAYRQVALSSVAEAKSIIVTDKYPAEYRCGVKSKFLLETIEQKIAKNIVIRRMYRKLRIELERSRFDRVLGSQTSALLKAKNFLMNLKDGKGFSTTRQQ